MPSPFPGMDPYLERPGVWHDFHERLCPALADAITAQVRPHFIVRIDHQVYIHELDAEGRQLAGRGDALVSALRPPTRTGTTATLEAPATLQLPRVDFEKLSFLEIRDRDSNEIVTVIEALSPTNKAPGPDREQYSGKRRALLKSAVHFVELDLLRGWARMTPDDRPASAYSALVSRWQDRPDCGYWPIGLRERLPTIPIPLSEGHADVRLDLQLAFDRVYDGAGYIDYIYRTPPQPALAPEDAAWAAELVPAA